MPFVETSDWQSGSRLRRYLGAGIALLISCLVAGLLISIGNAGTGQDGHALSPDIAHLVRMGGIQAGLTVILSLLAGIGIAWSLNRLKFTGHGAITALFGAAIVMPGLVVAAGLLSVWGRNGWVNQAGDLLGLGATASIYGLGGILTAHVILDGAYAGTILNARLAAIPDARLKTGRSLRLSGWQRFALIDWPQIAGSLPGLGAIIFLLAFTSFPIVLLMGGGPANQTLEVAIYALVRFDFDLRGAALLGFVQVAICVLIVVPATLALPKLRAGATVRGYFWPEAGSARMMAIAILVLGIAGFGLPLLAVLGDGVLYIGAVARNAGFWRAAGYSLLLGSVSALVALVLALGLTLGRAELPGRLGRSLIALPALSYLAVPGVVLALGFWLLIRQTGLRSSDAGPFVLITANALLTLPFALSVLGPRFDSVKRRYDRLGRSLRLGGWQRFLLIEWPLAGREAGLVLALGFCFSLGDLSVISLFGTERFTTLPLEMFRASGAYRSHDAAAIAAVLMVLTASAFFALPALVGRLCNART